jgi:glutathione S-transferase
MSQDPSSARFKLYYWPLPFRSSFITHLFAFQGVPLQEERRFEVILAMWHRHPKDQPIPLMGPPLLQDLQTGQMLSQLPAIVLHVSRAIELLPDDPFDQAMAMKVLMDCNDVLVEICRSNGSTMWDREIWIEFRGERLPRWLAIFEEMRKRGHFGGPTMTFADIAVHALFANMVRCLPELEVDLYERAPKVQAHCREIGANQSLADYVASEASTYGQLYCGGQIEESIRAMLAEDQKGPVTSR